MWNTREAWLIDSTTKDGVLVEKCRSSRDYSKRVVKLGLLMYFGIFHLRIP